MAESSGSLKTSNGSSHVNGKMNGHTAGRRRPTPKRRNFIVRILNTIARLATWAVILTIFFRCPSSLEACDENSPFICKHYFQAKALISPHAQPYYEQFVTPYVDFVKPYYNTVDSFVLTPTRIYAVQYGAPWVKKGQKHAWAQWEKHGQPQVAQLRALSQRQYDQSIAPYLTRAGEVVGPYYEIGRTNSLQLFYEFLLPTYQFAQPYAVQGYSAASTFATETALPAAHWTWNKTNTFLDKAVWPQMRIVYMENVEPQLVRIGERLGRHKNKTWTKAIPVVTSTRARSSTSASESPKSSFSKPAPQSTASLASTASEQTPSPVSSASSANSVSSEPETPTGGYWNPVQAPPPTEDETEGRRQVREMVAQDLEMWQNKFAAQADEGAIDMEDRIDELAQRMIDEDAKVKGRALVEKLESTIKSEIDGLKLKISAIIADSSDSNADMEEQVIAAIRPAGMAIKKAAQNIRSWREDYDQMLQETVTGIADVHFQILEQTRGLALQQIGMKWAWTDGVTYRDWAKYHELKGALAEWTDELQQLVVTHPTLLQAQDASAQVEDDGMAIASAAAKELARLKQVAHWKILAKDASDNFDSEAMQLAADVAQKPAEAAESRENVAEVVEGISNVEDTTDAAAEAAGEGDSTDSMLVVPDEEPVTPSEPGPAVEVTSSVVDTAGETLRVTERQFESESQNPLSSESEKQDTLGDVESASVLEANAASVVPESVDNLSGDEPGPAVEAQETLHDETDKDLEFADEPAVNSVSDSHVPTGAVPEFEVEKSATLAVEEPFETPSLATQAHEDNSGLHDDTKEVPIAAAQRD